MSNLDVVKTTIRSINVNMDNILSTCDINRQISEMNKAFHLTRRVLQTYPGLEDSIIDSLRECNRAMKSSYIIRFNPYYRKLSSKEASTLNKKLQRKYSNKYEFLNDFVIYARNQAYMSNWDRLDDNSGFKVVDIGGHCSDVSKIVKEKMSSLGINCEIVRIYFGFSQTSTQENKLIYHDFNLVKLGNTTFLMDISYQQFFLLSDNMMNSMGILGYPQPFPGIYMLQNSSRIDTARNLLCDGFIEANDRNLKNYFDGFALSFRNALFYDRLYPKKVSYTTSYTADDYKSFLEGKDSQIKKEGQLVLGTQRQILENQDINFSENTAIYENSSKRLVMTI